MLRFASALERVTPLKSLRHETKRRKASGTQLPNRTGREPDGTSIMQLLPANLRHAARFAASNDTRYAVSGLLLESKPDGSYRLDATDTRKAIIVTGTSNPASRMPAIPAIESAPNGGTKSLINAKAFGKFFGKAERVSAKQVKICPPSVQTVIGEKITTLGTINKDGSTAEVMENIEARFPPMDSIFPTKRDCEGALTFRVDAKMLAEMLESLAGFTESDSHAVRFTVRDRNKPIMVEVVKPDIEGQQVKAIIMPLFSKDA